MFAQFFLTPATWKEKVREHRSAPIRLGSTAPQSTPEKETATAAPAVRKKEGSWCTIETPAQVAKDGTFHVKLTLKKDIPAGMKVGGDIHLKNSDTGAYVGYGAWGGAGDRFSLDDGGQRPTGDEMPWQQGTESTAAAEPESLVLLIACVGVLAAGILAAALYRRRS